MTVLHPEDKETFVPIYQTTWRHFPEDSILHSHRRGNLTETSTLKLDVMTFFRNVGT
jgi:hypothetical protein